MGFFQRLISGIFGSTVEASISVLGPSKAGKTTLIRYLETGEPVVDAPLSTLGMDYRKEPVEFDGVNLNVMDVGGQKTYQDAFWDFAIEQSEGLIYVIDATVTPQNDEELFKTHIRQFNYVMDILPINTVLLILLNKQDLEEENPISTEEFGEYYPLEKIKGRTTAFLPSSAKFGDGVEKAFEWFVSNLKDNL